MSLRIMPVEFKLMVGPPVLNRQKTEVRLIWTTASQKMSRHSTDNPAKKTKNTKSQTRSGRGDPYFRDVKTMEECQTMPFNGLYSIRVKDSEQRF